MAAEETFKIKSNTGDDLIVSIWEYKKLRDRIRANLQKFYKDCDFKDAGMDDADIVFFCTIYGKTIIKRFNAGDWLDAERSGRFNEMYTEFTKSKKKSSVSIGSMVGNGDGNFRKKKSH